jgi:hypothetical protein
VDLQSVLCPAYLRAEADEARAALGGHGGARRLVAAGHRGPAHPGDGGGVANDHGLLQHALAAAAAAAAAALAIPAGSGERTCHRLRLRLVVVVAATAQRQAGIGQLRAQNHAGALPLGGDAARQGADLDSVPQVVASDSGVRRGRRVIGCTHRALSDRRC